MADTKLSDIEQQLGSSTRLRFVDVKSSNVVLFAKEYLKFYDAKGVAVDRRDTEFFWSYEVRNTYARDDPEFDRLLSQVHSPANEEFWAHRTDPDGYQLRKQLQAPSAFWVFPREPTEDEFKSDPGLLILGDRSRSFLLPGYYLKPVTAIQYSTFVHILIMSNRSLSFDYATIIGLWSTLVQDVYHFEKDDVKSAKLREADVFKMMVDDGDKSKAVTTHPNTMRDQTIVKDEGSRMRGVEQLEQENALLRLEADKLRSKLGRLRK